MKQQTKIIIGLGAVSILGYLVWKQTKNKKSNADGRRCEKPQLPCPRLVGACYTPTRGTRIGTAPIGCFG